MQLYITDIKTYACEKSCQRNKNVLQNKPHTYQIICLQNDIVYISKNLCNANKAVLRENYIVFNAYTRKEG